MNKLQRSLETDAGNEPGREKGAPQTCALNPEQAVQIIEKALREQIELAKPDDVAFLEFQAPRIAAVIAARLGWLDGPLE